MNTLAIPASDRFDWRRVALLGRYYWPNIRRQLVIYAVSLAVLDLCYALSQHSQWFTVLGVLGSLIAPYLFYLTPFAFVRDRDLTLSTMLPATAGERATFIFGYSMVLMPLFMAAVVALSSLVFWPISNTFWDFGASVLRSDTHGMSWGWMVPTAYFPMCATLLVLLVTRKAHIIKGLIAAFAANIFQAVLMGCIALWVAKGYIDGDTYASEEEAMQTLVNPILMVAGIVITACCLALLWFSYRAIKNRQA